MNFFHRWRLIAYQAGGKALRKPILALLFALLLPVYAFAATLLPPGKQQFFDANGNPLSSGFVYMYIPNTLTPKTTWQDAGQSILNTNPIQLDAGGFAVIYGSGQYRQIVKDASLNTIYDQLTTSTAEVSADNIQYYATAISGAPNAIIVTATNPSDFSLTIGKTLRIIAPFSNTGTTTANILALGSKTIKRSTANLGVINLAGGEIVSGGVYDLLYNGTDLLLLNPSVQDMPGTVVAYYGTTEPNGYVFAFGQAISRSTFSGLFSAISTSCGVGDGVTTFNVCDLRGRVQAGKDNMGGVAASRLTTSSGLTGSQLGAAAGDQLAQQHNHGINITDPTHNHIQNAHNHSVNDPGHAHSVNIPSGTVLVRNDALTLNVSDVPGAGSTSSASTGISIQNATATNQAASTGISATSNNAFSGAAQNVQPTIVTNYIMRL